MIVLGIDPGSVVTGYGVLACDRRRPRLVTSGCLRPGRTLPFHERLLRLHDGVCDLIRCHRPDHVAIEAVFHGANVETLTKMCQARGAILMAFARTGLPVFEYAPREIKKAVTGNGNASKEQVAYMVRKLFGAAETDLLDESDGIATALCHTNRHPAGGGGSLAGTGAAAGGATSLADRLVAAGADPRVAVRAARSRRAR